MKNKHFILTLLCLFCFALTASAQKQISFNAVAQNVDGLPKKVIVVEGVIEFDVNPDGLEGPGATTLGNAIAKQSWDIVGMSEDFNFHSELVAPLSGLYHIGEHDGKIGASTSNDTDGLGILLAKRDGSSLSAMTQVAWNTFNGTTDQGSDGLVDKGFRYYAVTLATGFTVDVYVLHMDADSGEKDIAARTSQLKQLATYIKSHNNNRPILIIGDTNCRYTRDSLQEDLINSINNADNGMTIKDAWIEVVRGGIYPAVGDDALMIDKLGSRKGEVVDKIFYINVANAPLQIAANTYDQPQPDGWPSDHWPVIVNFTLTNTTVADESAATLEDRWTVDVPTITETTIQGCTPTDGKTYYFKNVENKQYLTASGTWGTHAATSSAGYPVTLHLSGGKYRLCTAGTTFQMSPVYDVFFDNNGTDYAWTFEVVDATNNYYYVKCDEGYLTANNDQTYCRALDTSNKRQQWILLDEEQMKAEMDRSTTSFDCTPLIPTADFGRFDFYWPDEATSQFRKTWTGAEGCTSGQAAWTHDPAYVNYCVGYSGTAAHTLSYTLTDMPAGNYIFSYEAFYRSEKSMTPTISFAGTSNNIAQNTTTEYADFNAAAVVFRDNDTYHGSISKEITTDGTDITISVNKPSVSSGSSWVAFDKFQLTYVGGDPTLEPRKTVADKMNETWTKVSALGEAAQKAYDISTVLYRYNNGYVKTPADATVLCAMIDEAYEDAVTANNVALANQAAQAGGGDVTAVIVNPSFESGNTTGWTIKTPTQDTGVYPNSNNTYTTSGINGTYLFNTWDGDPNSSASYIKQEIMGLKNGLYKLDAKVTSHAGRTIYLTGNNAHAGVVAGNNGTFNDATLLFLVEDGQATIGAVGASAIDGNFAYFMPAAGGYFKADDFRLAYVCDLAHGRLKLAIDKANAEAAGFDTYGKAAFNISSYETMYANKSVSGDGTTEANAVYAALNAAAKAQKTVNADMTYAITNPNFEEGNWNGWTVTTSSETVVSDLEKFATLGYDGTYLFNSWSSETNVKPIKQSISGLPKGKYKLTARMTSSAYQKDDGSWVPYTVMVSGNGTAGSLVVTEGVLNEVATEFEVTDGTAVIMAGGVKPDSDKLDETNGGAWFKADDFHLTYLGREVTLDEAATSLDGIGGWYTKVALNRTIPAGKWSTFVSPFKIEDITNLKVKEFTGDEMDGENIRLSFSDADYIEKGVPYMVKPIGDEAVNFESVTNIDLDMAEPSADLRYITVHGTYKAITIPTGAYFISDNQFWVATGDGNTSKGYRAYIMPNTTSGAKGIIFSLDGEDDGTTAINGIKSATDATVMGIYSVSGARLSTIEKGINIIKMSDGTIKKVYVK